jgi:hypothetical protein
VFRGDGSNDFGVSGVCGLNQGKLDLGLKGDLEGD